MQREIDKMQREIDERFVGKEKKKERVRRDERGRDKTWEM